MTSNNGLPPTILANHLTPWWMKRINDFDSLQVWPCRNLSGGGKTKAVLCREEQASFWTVFGHYRVDGASINGGIEPFEGFPNPVAAERFCERLRGTYKHLNGDRTSSAPETAPKPLTL